MRIHLEMEVKIKVLRIPSSEMYFGLSFYGQDFQSVLHKFTCFLEERNWFPPFNSVCEKGDWTSLPLFMKLCIFSLIYFYINLL